MPLLRYEGKLSHRLEEDKTQWKTALKGPEDYLKSKRGGGEGQEEEEEEKGGSLGAPVLQNGSQLSSSC